MKILLRKLPKNHRQIVFLNQREHHEALERFRNLESAVPEPFEWIRLEGLVDKVHHCKSDTRRRTNITIAA